MAPNKLTPAKKAAAKAFVKALKELKKNTKLENAPLGELLGVKPKRLGDWLAGRRAPDETAQVEVRTYVEWKRDELVAKRAKLTVINNELLGFIAVTDPRPAACIA